MLSDMDDIDKHMADTKQIFSIMHDPEALKNFDFLSNEERETLEQFLGFTKERATLLQQRFMRLWDKMHDIYQGLNAAQHESGRLYQGALYRDVCDNLSVEQLQERWTDVCFVGFNVLNKVEETLMLTFQKTQRARFYWDYDIYYTQQHDIEAGEFMRKNLSRFGSALPPEHFDNISRLHDVTFIACSTDNAQARYTTTWMERRTDHSTPQDAVVICNEQLLLPVMHSIPPTGDVTPNITMGFPLTDTPIYGFITCLIALQTDGYDTLRGQFRPSYLKMAQRHAYAALVPEEMWLSYVGDDQLTLL